MAPRRPRLRKTAAITEKDDLFRHRLGLACLALAEVPAPVRGRLSDWVDRLTKEAYDLYRRPVSLLGAEMAYLMPAMVALGRLNGRIGKTRFIDSHLPMAQPQDTYHESLSWFWVLGEAAATPEVLSILVQAVKGNANNEVRERAVRALHQLGEAAATPEVVGVLVGVVTDDANNKMRRSAASALGKLGEAAATPEVLGALVRAVTNDADSDVRKWAAQALGNLGEAAATPEAVSVLTRAVKDDADLGVRRIAAAALGRLGQAAATPEVVSVLLQTLGRQRGSARFVPGNIDWECEDAAAVLITFQNLRPARRIFEQGKIGSRFDVAKVTVLASLPSPDPITGIIGEAI